MANTWPELHSGTNFNYVWDTIGLEWVKETQSGGGGGGGGGAVTIADGADVAEGATTDAAVTSDTTGTVSGKLRGLVKWAYERMPASLGQKTKTNSFPVVVASDQDAIAVNSVSVVDSGNSTTATLGGGATFTGTGVDILAYRGINVAVKASHASATDGLSVQWSTDNANWDHTETYDIAANVARAFQLAPRAQYFRVVYTNGGTGQSYFRLQTVLQPFLPTPRKEPLDNQVDNDEAAIFTRSAIVGKTTAGGGAFVDVKVAPSGAVQVGGTVDVGTFPANQPFNLARVGGSAVSLGENTKANSIPVALPTDQYKLGTTVSLNGPGTLASIDATGYRSVGVRLLAGTLVGTLYFQASPDGVDWDYVSVLRNANPAGGAIGTTAELMAELQCTNPSPESEFTFVTAAPFRYFRIVVSTYISGSADAYLQATMGDSRFSVPVQRANRNPISAFGGYVYVPVNGGATGLASVSGTFTGTIRIAAFNGAGVGQYQPLYRISTGTFVTQITGGATGDFLFNAGPYLAIYAIATAWTSGTADVALSIGSAAELLRVFNDSTTPLYVANKATTSAVTSVANSASSVTLLAANANRLGAMIFNQCPTKAVYVKFGTTASATDFTIYMLPNGYLEVPFGYTGRIDGIWEGSAPGFATITEITA